MQSSKYLVLGNSQAAASAVDAIRSVDAQGSVTMVSPEDRVAYGTPLVSYIVKGATTEKLASIRSKAWYKKNAVNCVFGEGCAATAVDAAAKTVTLENGEQLGYEKLLVATGAVPFIPEYDGMPAHANNVFTFLNITSALALNKLLCGKVAAKKKAGKKTRVVVVGSGLVGSKAAEGIAHHVDETILMFRSQHVLPAVLDASGAKIVEAAMKAGGITVKPGLAIERVNAKGGEVRSIVVTGGIELEVDALVIATGMRANIAMLEGAGVRAERGIEVDEHMATGVPDIWAAGDVTVVPNKLDGATKAVRLWPQAGSEGFTAGLNMAGAVDRRDSSFTGTYPANAVGFFGEVNVITAGIIAAGEGIEEQVFKNGKQYAKFFTRGDLLVGFILVNRPEGAGIYNSLIASEQALSELPEDVFERPITMLDLPRAVREHGLLRGMPKEEGR